MPVVERLCRFWFVEEGFEQGGRTDPGGRTRIICGDENEVNEKVRF